MPLPLLHRSPVAAGRALAWPCASRATSAASSRLGLTPLAALRHVFRDRSTDVHDGRTITARPQNTSHPHPSRGHQLQHQQHAHTSTRQPHNHRKGPEMSTDWTSLYLGAKLAHWSGLCYFPHDTLAASLREEGLELVAYGRTDYTCWYVADGSVDVEALRHRALPPQQRQQQRVGSGGGGGGSDSGGGGGGDVAVAATATGSGDAHNHLNDPNHNRHHQHHVVVKDGRIHLPHPNHPHLRLPLDAAAAKQQRSPSSSNGSSSNGNGVSIDASAAAVGGGGGGSPVGQQAATAAASSSSTVAAGKRCRYIFLRGVQWSAPETKTWSLYASLANFWPTPLMPPGDAADGNAGSSSSAAAPGSGLSSPSGTGISAPGSGVGPGSNDGGGGKDGKEHLVAHSGVAAMARELFPVLLPHIRGAAAAGAEHVVFAGHSLGGSLAKLVWATSCLRGHSSPGASSVHTFGSPPVLAHSGGGGGARVLRLLRAPPSAIVNWVLEHDPVPRAMLTADPYFAAARKAVPGLSALLALRGAVLGEGAALSSGRFLFETVGELMLLRWSDRGGCEAVPVSEADTESLLQMALDEAATAPVRTLQYWLDHHHASYHHDLETAALAAYRQQTRSSSNSSSSLTSSGSSSSLTSSSSLASSGSSSNLTSSGSSSNGQQQ